MSQQDIIESIENTIRTRDILSVWNYVSFVVLPFIGVLVGNYVAPYLKKKATDRAENEGMKNALERLEKQTNSIKAIEEKLSHNYLETRELARITREKIELAYQAVYEDVATFAANLGHALNKNYENVVYVDNKAIMYISLYFKDELQTELKIYIDQRGAIISHIKNLTNRRITGDKEQCRQLMDNLHNARINIELALEELMTPLMKQESSEQI
ncbi:hypothetical protein L4C34_03530 [Vibrio profundum]|uniref:hypothetical protein n=1 Tax=Vibrio profundum TaxID=2910247 RepID=UPI003D0CAEAF